MASSQKTEQSPPFVTFVIKRPSDYLLKTFEILKPLLFIKSYYYNEKFVEESYIPYSNSLFCHKNYNHKHKHIFKTE